MKEVSGEIDVEVTPVEEEIMEEGKTFGAWLKECPVGKKSKKPKKGRIAAAVGLGLAVLGGAAIAIISKVGGGDVDVPELTDGLDPEDVPFDTELTDVAEIPVE